MAGSKCCDRADGCLAPCDMHESIFVLIACTCMHVLGDSDAITLEKYVITLLWAVMPRANVRLR